MAIKFCGVLQCSILMLIVSHSASGLDGTQDPIKSCPKEYDADSPCDTREKSNAMDSRIVGGQIADATKYPSYVSIRVKIVGHEEFEDYNGCGGVLVADRWVLTAAHCKPYFPAGDPINVVYGTREVGVHLDNEGEFSGRIKTLAYFIYPSENLIRYRGVDIALLYLAEGATQYGAEIMDLYTGSKPLGREVTPVGLGLTGPGSQAFDPDLRFLHYFDSEVTNDIHCMSIINGGSIYNPQHDLCVGKEGVYQTIGASDSGGPLYIRNKYTGRMAVAGIVGGFVDTDPDQQEPGNTSREYSRFAMVSYVADWVYKTIDENS